MTSEPSRRFVVTQPPNFQSHQPRNRKLQEAKKEIAVSLTQSARENYSVVSTADRAGSSSFCGAKFVGTILQVQTRLAHLTRSITSFQYRKISVHIVKYVLRADAYDVGGWSADRGRSLRQVSTIDHNRGAVVALCLQEDLGGR